MISWENYEEYMMMHADGELQEAEEEELLAFVAANPQLKSELEEYSSLHLVPDTTMVYANKQALLKEAPVAAKRIIAFPVWKKYSIAAAAAALLFVTVYGVVNSRNDNDSEVVLANNSIIATPKVTVPVKQETNMATTQEQRVIAQSTTVAPTQHAAPAPQHKEMHNEAQVAQQATRQNVTTIPMQERKEEERVAQTRESEPPIAPLPVAGTVEIQATENVYATVDERAVPDYLAEPQQVEEKKTFLDRLPVDDIKKKQIGSIAGAIKDATGGQKWSLKVEKKKFVLSF